MKEINFTQATFDRTIFAVRSLFNSDIAEATVKALAELVQDWGEMRKKLAEVEKPAEATTAPATEADNEEI